QLGAATVQCQTAVGPQCQNFIASALLGSGTSLVPILDLGLSVQLVAEKGSIQAEVPVQLSSSQMRGRQAMLAAVLPRPRRLGNWLVQWMLGDMTLAVQKIRTVSRAAFNRSLRLATTRFILQQWSGDITLARTLPDWDQLERVGPCFWVSSSEPGMAGWC